MTRKQRRNKKIREEIENLKDLGYKIKDALCVIADKYFLSPETIKDIWYEKR